MVVIRDIIRILNETKDFKTLECSNAKQSNILEW